MRKRPAAIVGGLLAWLLLCSNALAATLDINVGGKEVYAKGNSVTVEASGSSGDKTVVTADDNSTVTYNRLDGGGTMSGDTDVSGYTIYGGSKDGNVEGNTSVTVNGGTVGDVYGGGNNGDVNGNTSVTVAEGATTGDVYGGGHAEGGDANSILAAGSNAQANVTGDTNVTVNGGSTGDVYGGGHAEGGDANKSWSIGGSAIANVEGQANVTINGGSTGDVRGGGNAKGGHAKAKHSAGGPAAANVENTNVEVKGGTVTGDVYGGGSSTNLGLAKVGNDTQVTIDDTGVVEGAVYGSGDTPVLTYVEGESRIIIEGGDIQSGQVYANHLNTRIDLNDTSAFYYTYHVKPGCKDFQLNDSIVAEYGEPDYTGCSGGYCIYQFQEAEEPRTVTVVFQYTYNGTVIEAVTKKVPVEFFQTADKGRGVTVDSTYTGSSLYKPASGSATVYFNSEQMTVPIKLERYSRDNNDDDDEIPLTPGAEANPDIPLGLPRTGDAPYSLLSLLVFAGISLAAKARRRVK